MSNQLLIARIKDEMEKKNWTGRKLSKKANLSYNAVHYIISGKKKKTNFEIVSAIADVLEVSPFYLLGREEGDHKHKWHKKPYLEEESSKNDIEYDGDLYREVMVIVEHLLSDKDFLTTKRVEYFSKKIYPQVKKMQLDGKKKDIRTYIEGILDYALNFDD